MTKEVLQTITTILTSHIEIYNIKKKINSINEIGINKN